MNNEDIPTINVTARRSSLFKKVIDLGIWFFVLLVVLVLFSWSQPDTTNSNGANANSSEGCRNPSLTATNIDSLINEQRLKNGKEQLFSFPSLQEYGTLRLQEVTKSSDFGSASLSFWDWAIKNKRSTEVVDAHLTSYTELGYTLTSPTTACTVVNDWMGNLVDKDTLMTASVEEVNLNDKWIVLETGTLTTNTPAPVVCAAARGVSYCGPE